VRVTLQLTDARTGFSVWSDSIDGRRDNLLKLIDDVSSRTVAGLTERIGVQQSQATRSQARSSNPKAYEEYLRARALNGSFEPKHYAEQVAALKRAIELDPQFAAAYADLAATLSLGSARSLASAEDLARRRSGTRGRPCASIRISRRRTSPSDASSCAIRPLPRIRARGARGAAARIDRHAGAAFGRHVLRVDRRSGRRRSASAIDW
jgi:hypothetical protein